MKTLIGVIYCNYFFLSMNVYYHMNCLLNEKLFSQCQKMTLPCSLMSLQVEDPLGESLKYLRLLQDHSADALETHLLAFEVYMRKNKKLLALQVFCVPSKGFGSLNQFTSPCLFGFKHMHVSLDKYLDVFVSSPD